MIATLWAGVVAVCALNLSVQEQERTRVPVGPLKQVLDGDSVITEIPGPVFPFKNREVRAAYALLWTDRGKPPWTLDEPADLRVGEPAVAEVDLRADDRGFSSFDELLSSPRLQNVRELYLEGPVEFYEGGQRVGVADALYLDRVEGHGWLSNAQIEYRDRVGGSRFAFRVDSEWLRISSDGSLVSNSARITTCEHADPHYVIRTKQLRMEPTGDPSTPWRVKLSGNAIKIGSWFSIPLPPINYLADEEGEPALRNLRFGDSGQFGPSVGFGYSREVESYGLFDRILKGPEGNRFDSKFRVDLDYLGSRGLLTDLSLRLKSEDRYSWRTDFALIPDGDVDRGLVQVPEEDRDNLRLWLRSRGRFDLGRDQWIDLVLSDASDPGVQSEFFEREYLEFEERETFLHYRKAFDANYLSVSAVASLDEFQTQVEELPEFDYVRQRTTLVDTEWAPFVYSSATSAGWYRRQEGDPQFEGAFADGLGERSTWRFDSEHRMETPMDLGWGGWRLVPFARARWTGWTEAAVGDDGPSRTALTGGARLTTTVWRRTPNGGLQELSPIVGWSADAVFQETGGDTVEIDETEQLLSGRFVDLGLRGRMDGFNLFGLPAYFDGEIRTRYGEDLEVGPESRWLPVELLGELRTQILRVPVRIRHDSRTDVDDGATLYSHTNLSFDPIPRMTLDFSFASGRNDVGTREFEAAFFGGAYRFTPKWELEASQTLNLDTSNALDSRATIRRYGHDLVFEIQLARRSGEGGSSLGFRVKPAITANRRPQVPTSEFDWAY